MAAPIWLGPDMDLVWRGRQYYTGRFERPATPESVCILLSLSCRLINFLQARHKVAGIRGYL